MPRIKTRKVMQKSVQHIHRIKKKPQVESTPENSATGKIENTAKYTAYDTARFLGRQTKKHLNATNKKDNVERAKQSAKIAKRIFWISKSVGKAVVVGVKAAAKITAEAGKALVSAIVSGGWVAVVVILIVFIMLLFGAFLFSGEEEISNDEIPFYITQKDAYP